MVFVSRPLAKYCFLLFLFFVIGNEHGFKILFNIKILNNLLPPTFS